MILQGRKVVAGAAEGEALVSAEPISFYGGVDPVTGTVVEPGHPLKGQSMRGRILVFPTGKGSTVGSYVIYQMSKLGTGPAAIINRETEAIIATGCVIGSVPLVDKLNADPVKVLSTGMRLRVDAAKGTVEVL